MKEIQLSVTKMSCGACVKHVERAIQSVAGVQSVQVDLSTGVAKVKLNSQETDSALADALAEAGYPSTITSISN
jgi:copper chaperone CopZ